MTKTIKTAVLVIGGGGAGCRAAIEAFQAGAQATLAVKGRFGWRGGRGTGATSYSTNFYAYYPPTHVKIASTDEEREIVYKRIIQCGLGLADRRLARVLAEDGPEARRKLEGWGVVRPARTSREAKDDAQVELHAGGTATMVDLNPGLANVIRGATGITVLEQTMVTGLLIQDGMCVGAVAVDEASGEPLVLHAGATIIATGGQAQLYRYNRHPSCVTGDGYALGYHAGAELMNTEFIYTDIGSASPNNYNIISDVWREHPVVRNADGDEFISKYLPSGVTIERCLADRSAHNPFSARDLGKYVDIAITNEIRAGRVNEHGACLLDGRALRKCLRQNAWDWHRYLGIDLSGEYVEITMIYHCSHGGFRIDEHGQTTIPGLYAVGEVATGMHGADRLGGAMISAGQIFGRRAGIHAALVQRGVPAVDDRVAAPHLSHLAELKQRNGGEPAAAAMSTLKHSAWRNLLSVRTGAGIAESLRQIEEIRDDVLPHLSTASAPELVQALELEHMSLVGQMTAKAALMRTESRGTHYREDFPEQDDGKWMRAITVRKIAGEMQLGTAVIDEQWQLDPDDFGGQWWA